MHATYLVDSSGNKKRKKFTVEVITTVVVIYRNILQKLVSNILSPI
jgi:hypothetical protein